MPLNQQALKHFSQHGFVKATIFDAEDLLPLKAEIAACIEARAAALKQGGSLGQTYDDQDFYHRMASLMHDCPEIAKGFDIDSLLGEEMFKFMAHHKLTDALASLLGEEILCSAIQHLRVKPPLAMFQGQGSFFSPGWHQDSGVSQPESDTSLIVTCWIPLGHVSEDMGCLHLIPGQYQHLVHQPSPEGTSIPDDSLPGAKPVALTCVEGEVIFMNQFVPHRSFPNHSDRCRWSVDLRYQAAGTPSARPWLPEFVCQSAEHPGQADITFEEWRHQWQHHQPMPADLNFHRVG